MLPLSVAWFCVTGRKHAELLLIIAGRDLVSYSEQKGGVGVSVVYVTGESQDRVVLLRDTSSVFQQWSESSGAHFSPRSSKGLKCGDGESKRERTRGRDRG